MTQQPQGDKGSIRKHRIVYVWNYASWGGAQIYFFSLMKEAAKVYDISAWVPENSASRIFEYLRSRSIHHQLLPPASEARPASGLKEKLAVHLRWALDERRLTRELIRGIDLDNTIVHIDLGFWQSFTTLLRLSLKTRVFVTIHTALPEVSAWRKVIWKVKGESLSRLENFHVLTSNEEARRSLEPYLSSAKFRNVTVAYSGVDPDEIDAIKADLIDRRTLLEQYGLDPDRPIVVTTGQFIARKGCWVSLDALKLVEREGLDVQYLWLATSLPDRATQDRISSYGLKHFRLLTSDEITEGRKGLLSLVDAADIFVLASFQEGLPIALVEAMSLGKACIATNVNAIPEAIDHEVSGLLIEPADPDALAASIANLIKDDALRLRLGERAKTKAYSKFDARQGALTTVDSYHTAFVANT